jgi:hypothetical protein
MDGSLYDVSLTLSNHATNTVSFQVNLAIIRDSRLFVSSDTLLEDVNFVF